MIEKVRVAEVILDPGFGGGHKHVLDLAANLSRRFEPIIFSSSREMLAQAKKAKIAAVALPTSRFFGIEDVKPLRQAFVKREISLLHAHGPRAGWACVFAKANLRLPAILVGKRGGRGLPMVYTDHAWNPDYAIRRTRAVMQLAGLRLVCRAANKVISVSSASRQFLVGQGIARPEKVIIIPNGIMMPAVYDQQSTAHRRSPKAVDSRPIVGSVGVFNARKGHDVFVEALPHVLAKNPRARFAIIGDGPERLNVEKLAIRLGVRRFIHMPGRVDDEERDNERRKWTVYVQSSRDESFGIAAAEALAMGIPVVGANVGGLPDVVNGGGIIVEKESPKALAEAILKLLSNSKLRGRLAKRGLVHVRKNFDLKSVVKQIENVYETMLIS